MSQREGRLYASIVLSGRRNRWCVAEKGRESRFLTRSGKRLGKHLWLGSNMSIYAILRAWRKWKKSTTRRFLPWRFGLARPVSLTTRFSRHRGGSRRGRADKKRGGDNHSRKSQALFFRWSPGPSPGGDY